MIKWLGLPYRQKENLYSLIMILGDLIVYKNKMIYFKIGLVELELEGRHIIILFNVLLLRKNKVVLRMPFL